MNKAIFLDRDGTLIKDVGHINNKDSVVFYDYTFESLLKLQKHFMLFIISNQSGISKKIVTKEEVDNVNDHIIRVLNDKGIIIQKLFYCPHKTEDNCICKKPKPYFVNEARKEYNIDVSQSYVIGDHPSDILLALNSGTKGIYLLTGHGKKHLNEIEDNIRSQIIISLNLKNASNFILKHLI